MAYQTGYGQNAQGGGYDQYGQQGYQQQGGYEQQQAGYGGQQQQQQQQGGYEQQQAWGGQQQQQQQQGGPGVNEFLQKHSGDSAEEREFYKVINEIRRDKDLNMSNEISEYVVCGPQSCGKSTLIENIAGFKFNHVVPSATGTRRPLRLELIRNPNITDVDATIYLNAVDFKQVQGKANSLNRQNKEGKYKLARREIADVIATLNQEFIKDVISMTIESPNSPNIVLVDTPGTVKYEHPECQSIDPIVRSQLARKNAVILLLFPANGDPGTLRGHELVREADPTLDRTVVVFTKVRSTLKEYTNETCRRVFTGAALAADLRLQRFKYHFLVESPAEKDDLDAAQFAQLQLSCNKDFEGEIHRYFDDGVFQEFKNIIGIYKFLLFLEKLYLNEAKKMIVPAKDTCRRVIDDQKGELSTLQEEESARVRDSEGKERNTRYGVVNFLEFYFHQQHVVLEGDHSQSGRPEKYGHSLLQELGDDFIGYEPPVRIPIERVTNYRAKLLGMAQLNRMYEELRMGIMSLFLPCITDSDLLSYAGDVTRDSIGFGEIIQKILNNQFATATLPIVRLVRRRLSYIMTHFNNIVFNLMGEKIFGKGEEDDSFNDFDDAQITASYQCLRDDFQSIYDEVLKIAIKETLEACKRDAKKSYQRLANIKLMEIQSKEVQQYAVQIIINTQIQFTRLLDDWCKSVVREISNNFKHKMTFYLRLKVMQHFHCKTDAEINEAYAEGRDASNRIKLLESNVQRLNELLPKLEKAINILPNLERKL